MKLVKLKYFTIFLIVNCLTIYSIANSSQTTSIVKFENPFGSKTNPNLWGNGSIFYLDRHNLDCGPRQILQGFHLIRPSPNQIAYEYKCKNSSSVLTPYYSEQTPWNDTNPDEFSSTNFLDRHEVKCKNGYGLQQFKLMRNRSKIYYNFRCAQIKARDCQSHTTEETLGNNRFETIYLDRQKILVSNDRALTQFRLLTRYANGNVYYRYRYSSCKLDTPNNPGRSIKKKITNTKKSKKISINKRNIKKSQNTIQFNKKTVVGHFGEGSVFNFDKHNLDCGKNHILQGFHLTRPTSTTLSYEYACKRSSAVDKFTYKTRTVWNSTGNNDKVSTNYLDRHDIVCKKGFAIQQVRLLRNNSKIAFEYRCAKVNLSNCKVHFTQETFGSNRFENIYLDRQRIFVGKNHALQQFKLFTRYSKGNVYYKYKYTSCLINEIANSNKKKNVPKMKPPKKNLPSLFNSRTSGSDWGNGSIFKLINHNLDCGKGQILQGFHLTRPTPDKISYEFACGRSEAVEQSTYNSQCQWNETANDEGSSTNYLDRHQVRCKNGYAIQQVQLIRNGRKIAYVFRCVQVRMNNCQSHFTKETFGNSRFENIYLDRQQIHVGFNKVLTRFKLHTRYARGNVYYRYSYTSCNLDLPKPKVKPLPRIRIGIKRIRIKNFKRQFKFNRKFLKIKGQIRLNLSKLQRKKLQIKNNINKNIKNLRRKKLQIQNNIKKNLKNLQKKKLKIQNNLNKKIQNLKRKKLQIQINLKKNIHNLKRKKLQIQINLKNNVKNLKRRKLLQIQNKLKKNIQNLQKRKLQIQNNIKTKIKTFQRKKLQIIRQIKSKIKIKLPKFQKVKFGIKRYLKIKKHLPRKNFVIKRQISKPFNNVSQPRNWGSGSIFALRGINVNCGDKKLMQGFHLLRPNKNLIAYEFACVPNVSSGKSYNGYTRYDEISSNERSSTNYLDRHNVKCKKNHALQQFKLVSSDKKIAYSYRCAPVLLLDCQSFTTPETFGNTYYENIYLDRQSLFVGEGRVLTQFKLQSRYNGNAVYYSYSYTSCRVDENQKKENNDKKELKEKNDTKKKEKNNNNESKKKIDSKKDNNSKNVDNNKKSDNKKKDIDTKKDSKNNNDNKKDSKNNDINKKSDSKVIVNNKKGSETKTDSKKNDVKNQNKNQNKKINIVKVSNFCKNFCTPNKADKIKKCYDNGYKRCHPCIYKSSGGVNNPDSNALCSQACDAVVGLDTCDYFKYFNNKKKILSMRLLTKFGIILDK